MERSCYYPISRYIKNDIELSYKPYNNRKWYRTSYRGHIYRTCTIIIVRVATLCASPAEPTRRASLTRMENRYTIISLGASKHLIHISSTKGLRYGVVRMMAGDQKNATLKWHFWGHHQGELLTKPPDIGFKHIFEYIHQTCAKWLSDRVGTTWNNS